MLSTKINSTGIVQALEALISSHLLTVFHQDNILLRQHPTFLPKIEFCINQVICLPMYVIGSYIMKKENDTLFAFCYSVPGPSDNDLNDVTFFERIKDYVILHIEAVWR